MKCKTFPFMCIFCILCAYFTCNFNHFQLSLSLSRSILATQCLSEHKVVVYTHQCMPVKQWYFCKRYLSGALIFYLERVQPLCFSFLCVHAPLRPARWCGNPNLSLVKLPSLELPHLLIVIRIGLEWVLGWIRP
mgnify:CR=1 FL=1